MSKQKRYIYILLCADGTYYTGISIDLERRLDEHNDSPIGAKYTRSRRPVQLVRSQTAADRGSATLLERQIKKLPKSKKKLLIENQGTVALKSSLEKK